jgi:hypothetical protein
VERKSIWSLGQGVRILDAKQLGSQRLISAMAIKPGVCAGNDQHADTAGMSVIFKICRRKALPQL